MKKKLHIILRYGITEKYLFKDLEKEMDINLIPYMMEPPKNLFLKITRVLFVGRFPLPTCILRIWFEKEFLESLKKIKTTDNILIFESINTRILGMISFIVPTKTKKYNWFLNPIYSLFQGKDPSKKLNAIKSLGYENITFDREDAKKYHLEYYTPFIRFPFNIQESIKEDIDFYFCGLPKNREKDLIQLKEALEETGYKCLFIIPGPIIKSITYEMNLEFVKRSKCIIDLYQKGQSGLTRRPLEALFYNKKLLTNNPDIKNYDFYNPNNIYILEKIESSRISDFMKKNKVEITYDIKKKYDIHNWLKRFMQ